MRVDSHHSYSERYPLAHLESILKRNKFEGSVLVSADGGRPEFEFIKGLVIRAGQPLRQAAIESFAERPWVRGICVRVAGTVPDCLETLERSGLALDAEGGLELVPQMAARHPALRIALDHLGAPDGVSDYPSWAAQIDRAAACPQVVCKLSGLYRLGEFARACVRHAMERFGPRRLMFGSDWPHSLPEQTWKASLAAFTQAIGAQTIEVREELLGGTAARFYAL